MMKRSSRKKMDVNNKKAHWKAYRALQTQVNKAWKALETSVKKRASSSTLARDQKKLVLLLGECNYMAREYKRSAVRQKKR